MPDTETIRIACAANSAYALPLAVMLRSMESHLAECTAAEVYVAHDDIPQATRDRVAASVSNRIRVHWRRAPALPASLPTWGRMPATTYQKLLLGEWVPRDTGKVLWLDCDLLICTSLSGLWSLPFAGAIALAAPDQRVPRVSSRFGVAGYSDLGLDARAKYFNAGVMVIDLERWRAEAVPRRSFEYLAEHKRRVYFWDQEALNAVLAGAWGELDPRWNWHPSLYRLENSARLPLDPWIVHFSGNLKPWTYKGSGAYHELYYRYLDGTAWSGWRPANRWRGRLLGWYETSALRRALYPAERWATGIAHAWTASDCLENRPEGGGDK